MEPNMLSELCFTYPPVLFSAYHIVVYSYVYIVYIYMCVCLCVCVCVCVLRELKYVYINCISAWHNATLCAESSSVCRSSLW